MPFSDSGKPRANSWIHFQIKKEHHGGADKRLLHPGNPAGNLVNSHLELKFAEIAETFFTGGSFYSK